MGLPLFKACNVRTAHIEELYSVCRLHVYFAEKKKTAQLLSLFTDERLGEVLKRTNYYAADVLFPFIAAFKYKSLDSAKRCELIRVTVLRSWDGAKSAFQSKRWGVEGKWASD